MSLSPFSLRWVSSVVLFLVLYSKQPEVDVFLYVIYLCSETYNTLKKKKKDLAFNSIFPSFAKFIFPLQFITLGLKSLNNYFSAYTLCSLYVNIFAHNSESFFTIFDSVIVASSKVYFPNQDKIRVNY